MPELPEVEVTKRGIAPSLVGNKITQVIVRQPQLRWLVPEALYQMQGLTVLEITRRAKYLLIHTEKGSALVHLGMSGSMRVLDADAPSGKHDHVELVLDTGKSIRYNDPRRFGAWLWQAANQNHPMLERLGPEPLTSDFSADALYAITQKKRQCIKQIIMDNAVVVGVGNIYANESLFLAHIHPKRAANSLSQAEVTLLVEVIKKVLAKAIEQGGTTLKDFSQADGKPGYFAQALLVYGRANLPCFNCGNLLEKVVIGQRNTVYCPHCQPEKS